MKLLFRIFNDCFLDGEWNVLVTVPESFGQNLQLNDMIASALLKSFPEFNSEHFLESLNEESLKKFNEDVERYVKSCNLTKENAVCCVWSDWMADLNLTVTGRKWCRHRRQAEFYLEIWLESK